VCKFWKNREFTLYNFTALGPRDDFSIRDMVKMNTDAVNVDTLVPIFVFII
jgi:hypothetical protein